MTMMKLVILYGTGGLSDVGRHAVQAALEQSVEKIQVLTRYPGLLGETNWKCGCLEAHGFTDAEEKHIEVVSVQSWDDESLLDHFRDAGAVVSCLGNRQPFIGGWESAEGNIVVQRAMKEHNIGRVVAISSVGVEEDWPPLEYFFGGKILAFLFRTFGRPSFKDLTKMERAYRSSDLDYLLVRPVGLGEEEVPLNEWFVQESKYKDRVGLGMAKLDVARYMVEEALRPTRRKTAVTLGSRLTEEDKAMQSK